MSILPAVESGAAMLPRGAAFHWEPALLGLHALADGLIAAAFLAIGAAILYLLRNRPGLVFRRVFFAFALIVVSTGLAHLFEVLTIWQPQYWISGLAKLIAALVALAAAVVIVRVIPAAIALPTRAELQRLNVLLQERASAHTNDLLATNAQLRSEAVQREQAEAEVRRLNAELQARLLELQSLFKLLPVGVAISTEPDCRRIRINQAFADIFGQPHEENDCFTTSPFARPGTFRVLHDGRELKSDELPMARAVAQNAPVRDFEQTIARSDGVVIEVLANAVPIRDPRGNVLGCVATLQDITAHKQAERQRLDFERKLLQSQKLESIGVLAGGIAHDFNNLLTGVLGHANFARAELARGSTAIDPLLAQVELSAQRAADLCRQLLAYAGKGRFVVRLIDLNLAVEQAVPLLQLSMDKRVRLELQLGRGLPPFRGDPGQMNQVLINLVTNAAEAIGAGTGVVTLHTNRVTLTAMEMLTLNVAAEMEPGPYVCLEVRDTGCGIPPEAIGHIFEPFFTTKFVGRGLGLAAVLGIVHGHRGGIRVSSQPGAGTTFELFLPVAAAPARPQPAIVPAPSGLGQATVLVVDDEETIRTFATTALRAGGYTVVTANDGEEAVEKLRQAPTNYDAVLLDLTMPKLDGEDTLMALRMLAPSLPVILTSGHAEESVVQRFVGRGVAQFIAKPFVAEALVSSVNSAIAKSPRGAS
ncbi:MAG: response regulator [Opitutaceae bacterium]|nr:response regulator [Opitutaceae bacterium]